MQAGCTGLWELRGGPMPVRLPVQSPEKWRKISSNIKVDSVKERFPAAEGRKGWRKMSEIKWRLVGGMGNVVKKQSSLKNYVLKQMNHFTGSCPREKLFCCRFGNGLPYGLTLIQETTLCFYLFIYLFYCLGNLNFPEISQAASYSLCLHFLALKWTHNHIDVWNGRYSSNGSTVLKLP